MIARICGTSATGSSVLISIVETPKFRDGALGWYVIGRDLPREREPPGVSATTPITCSVKPSRAGPVPLGKVENDGEWGLQRSRVCVVAAAPSGSLAAER
jgi:hypothetical protein